jgi:hypothetical protein
MDLTLDQSKQLAGFVQDWFTHPLLEVEATFGKDGAVDSTTFLHIAQRIRAKGWTVLAQQDYLNILTPNQIRFTLDGLGIIQSYCRDDNLEGKDFTSMMKDRASSESNVNLHEYHISKCDVRNPLDQRTRVSWTSSSSGRRCARPSD